MKQISGRTLILLALGLAAGLAGCAWIYQLQATRRAAEFWGRAGVELLVHAEVATVFKLDEPSPGSDAVATLAGQRVVWKQEAAGTPGLIHLRHALTQDRNFRWSSPRPPGTTSPQWGLAIQLGDGDGDDVLTVLFDRRQAFVGKLGAGGQIAYVDCQPMQQVLRTYFNDIGWLSDPGGDVAADATLPALAGP